MMKRLVDFLTKGFEIVGPTFGPTEIGVVGIKRKTPMPFKAINHGVEHGRIFGKKAGIHTNVPHHLPTV